jgi:2-haloacid dehalogenase
VRDADRWATFDCYGTLVDWHAGISGAAESVAPGRGAELLAAYHRLEPAVEAEPPFRPYRDVLRETLSRAAAAIGAALPPGGEDVLGAALPGWPVYADVGPALGALRETGWKLAILSNVDRDLLAGTARHLPVPFDLVVTAEEVRSYKPAPGHLRRFQELTGAAPVRWVHVAGSVFHDIAPARAHGVRGVYIVRTPEKEDARAAEAMLPDLRALPAVLDALVS